MKWMGAGASSANELAAMPAGEQHAAQALHRNLLNVSRSPCDGACSSALAIAAVAWPCGIASAALVASDSPACRCNPCMADWTALVNRSWLEPQLIIEAAAHPWTGSATAQIQTSAF